jgi:Bacterial type II/III secretion system short domain
MQQQGGKPGAPGGGGSKPRSDRVYIIANDRANSLIVHAPPNKKALIASFIKRVDVPNEMANDFERMKIRTKVFRLTTLSPTELVASLNAMDVLDPTTKLQVNEENKSLIAYASVSDQYLIQDVIQRLDGSQRSMHVKNLRRLNADSVAGSIRFLMGAGDEEKDNSRSNMFYYDPWSYNSSRSNTKKETDKMRVTANVQDNQLLLWVNDIELEEVEALLVKLGELPPSGGRTSTTRVIEASRSPETYEYLKRLKQQWEKGSEAALDIPDQLEFVPPESEKKDQESSEESKEDSDKSAKEPNDKPAPKPSRESVTRRAHPDSTDDPSLAPTPSPFTLASTQAETTQPPASETGQGDGAGDGASQTDESTTDAPKKRRLPPALADIAEENEAAVAIDETDKDNGLEPPANPKPRQSQRAPRQAPPPVSIMVDERGNLILQSDDTVALDRLEQWMLENKPPRRTYDVFKVKYARASWVSLNLRDYFAKEREGSNPRRNFWDWEFGGGSRDKQNDKELGKRPELQFIDDNDTQSIVVRNADDVQRQTIAELIKLWDVPDPRENDKSTARFTKLIPIKNTRAEFILTTVKEAYKDLLSANDSTFKSEGDEEKRQGGSSFSYKGKLSLGPDKVSNSILVSAEGEQLFKVVCDMIQELDDAAKDAGVIQVVSLGDGVGAQSMEKALKAIFSSPKAAAQPEQPQQPEQQGEKPQQKPESRSNSSRSSSNNGRSR